ncbi:fatty acid--CoA ligase [Sinimarinibacterium sp. CAU 1509]|uniref:FadD3 family acyl-CoA ligase n=1 Tax=Sinimarinibacterium sp. CAU 1509 TaxID=2562283 RepID=UPI0010AD742F|nr:FadD3 family acyl-CoA ligase [Sinimarinibacterium sp. CAU 1509]TJY58852.1 fatty acid--CoA ligase [Sinimarinibacterium sp. CAU 1509]
MIDTVPGAFAASVARYADRPALIGEDGSTLSYTQLDAVRLQATRALIALGVQRGDCVAIWAPNTVEWVIAALAVHSAGAALVPINTRMRGEEAAYVLERSRARVLFCIGNFLGQHYPALLAPHQPQTLETLVVLGATAPGECDWSGFLQHAERVEPDTARARAASVEPSDRMDVMFTSGTTGQPKGVITVHAQNLRVIREWSDRMSLSPEDRYLLVNPFFHAFGYKVGWLAGLIAGCAVMPHAVFDAAAVMRRIDAEKVSVLPGPPTLFISLLNDPKRADCDLSSLRATITGAAAVAPALVERIRSELGFKIVLTGYGLTETCGIVSLCDPDDSAETIVSTCGRPIPGIEVQCIGEDGVALPPNTPGEVVVRGYNVMQGYLDDAEETAKAIDADGWLHTGDVGVLDERGYLRITDRLKDMYITGGFNCYPAEIERMIAAHPAIAQVAVVGVPDERLGEVGKAYVVLRPGQTLDSGAFIAWCRDKMANYKVPRSVEVLDALPSNASGKVLKFELRKRSA